MYAVPIGRIDFYLLNIVDMFENVFIDILILDSTTICMLKTHITMFISYRIRDFPC